MSITVVANPVNLAWSNFRLSATRIVDPNDGTLVDAVTRFNFELRKRGSPLAPLDTTCSVLIFDKKHLNSNSHKLSSIFS